MPLLRFIVCQIPYVACTSRRSTDSYEQFLKTFIYTTTVAADEASVVAAAASAAIAVANNGD